MTQTDTNKLSSPCVDQSISPTPETDVDKIEAPLLDLISVRPENLTVDQLTAHLERLRQVRGNAIALQQAIGDAPAKKKREGAAATETKVKADSLMAALLQQSK